ncbi:hypothetical protein BDZ91DRAFT_719635, partial [Kalaharituber pfeilii]
KINFHDRSFPPKNPKPKPYPNSLYFPLFPLVLREGKRPAVYLTPVPFRLHTGTPSTIFLRA